MRPDQPGTSLGSFIFQMNTGAESENQRGRDPGTPPAVHWQDTEQAVKMK